MPWDSTDKYRDEDLTERRKRVRRRFKIGGRRKTDNQLPVVDYDFDDPRDGYDLSDPKRNGPGGYW